MYFAATFLIFCAACTVLAFVRHPIYGIYFYLAATYVFPPARWWGYMFGETRWSLIAAVVTVFAVLFNRGKLLSKPVWLTSVPAVVFALYAAWMWIQLPWALTPEVHIQASVQYLKYLVAFWFIYRIVDTKERARDLLLAHLLGCGLLGLYAYNTGRTVGDRLDGVGGPGIDDANTLGMYFATGAIVGLGLILSQSGWRRWLSLGCIVIVLEGLVLTNTRGAFLGLVAGGLVLTLFKAQMHRRLFWILAVVGLIGVASIVDQKFIDRMWSIEKIAANDDDADSSARSRVFILKAQVEMFFDHPMGGGHRATEVLSARYLDRKWLTGRPNEEGARSSHNTFMTALVEQGIPGAVLFIWLTLWTPLAMLHLRRLHVYHGDSTLTTLAAAIVGALTVIFFAGNTTDFLLVEVQFWLFATLAAILHIATMARADKRRLASNKMVL
jgi:O-antigen ligase